MILQEQKDYHDGCLDQRDGQIVYSGTKLNIKYWIDDMLDEQQEKFMIFMESTTDKMKML
jgi:hypothetical protein